MTKELLEKRKQIKKRKPTYIRAQSNQFPKLKNDPKWRHPKGQGNKNKQNRKGHVGTLKVGYGSPKAVKFTNPQGLKEFLVHRVEDLSLVDSKTQIALIGGTVGKRKKIQILEQAKKSKVSIGNVKDVDKTLETLKASIEKKSKKKVAKEETTKKEESSEKPSEKKETKKEGSKQ